MGIKIAKLVHCDATEYDFPQGDMVIFMYNPFGEVIMKKVIDNLCRVGSRRAGANLWILYSNPKCKEVLDSEPSLKFIGAPEGVPNIFVWKVATPPCA